MKEEDYHLCLSSLLHGLHITVDPTQGGVKVIITNCVMVVDITDEMRVR